MCVHMCCVCLCVCMCVSSMFIIDIADKLLGCDWMCLMSCRCESQQIKMRFCICTTAETPDRWRQMEGVSYCLASVHSPSHAFSALHTHIPVSLLLFVHSLTKLSRALQDILFCHPVVASERSYSSTTADTYHTVVAHFVFYTRAHTHTSQVAALRKKLQCADCWMVILTAQVIANSEMDDIRIGAVQP